MRRNRTRATRGAKHRRQSKRALIGGVIIVVTILTIVGVVSVRLALERDKVEVNASTMCPIDGPRAYTTILIDGTDTFSAIQVADLQRYFNQLKGSVQKYEQIAVFAPREMTDESLLQPVLKLCNPGDAKGVSGITANPDAIQRKYEMDFADKIDTALGRGLDAQGADTSPILEMIQAVVIDSFPINSSAPKRLIIVSDMLQNSDYYSHYRDAISFEILKNGPNFQHVMTDLSGVNVEILYIGRRGSEHLQTNRHGVFWEAYVRFMNGNLRSIKRIGG